MKFHSYNTGNTCRYCGRDPLSIYEHEQSGSFMCHFCMDKILDKYLTIHSDTKLNELKSKQDQFKAKKPHYLNDVEFEEICRSIDARKSEIKQEIFDSLSIEELDSYLKVKRKLGTGAKTLIVLAVMICLFLAFKSCSEEPKNRFDDVFKKDPNEWTESEKDYVDDFFEWQDKQND